MIIVNQKNMILKFNVIVFSYRHRFYTFLRNTTMSTLDKIKAEVVLEFENYNCYRFPLFIENREYLLMEDDLIVRKYHRSLL